MMGWYAEAIFLLLMRYAALTVGIPHDVNVAQNFIDGDIHQSLDKIDAEVLTPASHYEDIRLEHLGKVLANILVQPWPRGISPIIYVEEYPSDNIQQQVPLDNTFPEGQEINNVPFKRTRYYRKYPWKRQNSRYDAENRYLCQPSKEDVFRLLVALHEARQGNRGQIVNFCNRRRPASAIFTNIRFLG